MTLLIDFIDETETLTEEQTQLVQSILNFAADQEGVEKESEVSVTFVTNDRIQEINREYRNKDQATDVISFEIGRASCRERV